MPIILIDNSICIYLSVSLSPTEPKEKETSSPPSTRWQSTFESRSYVKSIGMYNIIIYSLHYHSSTFHLELSSWGRHIDRRSQLNPR